MAIQFLQPQQDPLWAGLGSGLGALLGGLGGLGVGVWQGKKHQQKQRDIAKQYEESKILTPQEAKLFPSMPPPLQMQLIKDKMKQREAERQAIASSYILGGKNILPGQKQQQQSEETSQMMQPGAGSIEQLLGGLNAQALGIPTSAQQMGQQPTYEQRIQAGLAAGLNPQMMNTLTRAAGDIEKQSQKQKELQSREEANAWKITQPYRTKMAERHESDTHLLDTLQEMAKLEKSGKMTDSAWLQFLEHFGLDYNVLKSPETEAYQALEKEFLRDLKSIFGGRISNQEMATFLRSIPRASNTPEGRKMIRERLDNLYKARSLQYKVMRKIISENKGIPPIDLQERVLDAMNSEKYKKQDEKYANGFMGIPKGAHLIVNAETGERGYETADGKMYTLEGF